MKIAICPGSFDPVTLGHKDVIERASQLFDKVIVLVLNNSSKKPMFTLDERMEFIKRCVDKENVEIDTYSGLLVDYARQHNVNAIIKGLRAVSDFDYEFQLALINKSLYPKLKHCLFLQRAKICFCPQVWLKRYAHSVVIYHRLCRKKY